MNEEGGDGARGRPADGVGTGAGGDVEHLFVYGTLRPGGGAPPEVRRRLEHGAEVVGRARVRGRLLKAESGRYPVLVRDRPGRWVTGDLYRLRSPRRLLQALDRYEGRWPDGSGLYRREVVSAHPLDAAGSGCSGAGTPGNGEGGVAAWTYLYNRDVSDLEEIDGGDWLRR